MRHTKTLVLLAIASLMLMGTAIAQEDPAQDRQQVSAEERQAAREARQAEIAARRAEWDNMSEEERTAARAKREEATQERRAATRERMEWRACQTRNVRPCVTAGVSVPSNARRVIEITVRARDSAVARVVQARPRT